MHTYDSGNFWYVLFNFSILEEVGMCSNDSYTSSQNIEQGVVTASIMNKFTMSLQRTIERL